PDRDEILLDGRPLPRREKLVYVLLNKPRGYVTTLSDERGRRTVADLVRDCGARVYPVGRLDRDSEGLLLLTNDGPLTRFLTHPSTGTEKVYQVTVSGEPDALEHAAERLSRLDRLEDGTPVRPAEASALGRTEKGYLRLSVTIREGKNRQVRRLCALCGLEVRRLCRIREHTLELGNLKPGRWRYLTEAEAASLRRDCGGLYETPAGKLDGESMGGGTGADRRGGGKEA
ncbi:MAG: rRNA pseudouridine synthase, partial [Oscillibacter sp.]|nr:rRNA pseudouridine synthase [Oscillibacter sp.]